MAKRLTRWWDRFSVRRRLAAIEEALWENGQRPSFLRVLDGSMDERIINLNHKLDLLADKIGVRFVYENELPFRLMKKSDYEKMRNEQEKSW